MRKIKSLYFIVLSMIAAITAGCVNEETPPVETLIKPGDMLPYFSVEMSDGAMLTTEMLRGQPSMIVLFTTTCGDCRRILPQVNKYSLEHPEVKVVCIARDESKEPIAEFWALENLTMDYSPQPDRTVYSLFATGGVPRIYCADSSLRVTAAYLEEFPLM